MNILPVDYKRFNEDQTYAEEIKNNLRKDYIYIVSDEKYKFDYVTTSDEIFEDYSSFNPFKNKYIRKVPKIVFKNGKYLILKYPEEYYGKIFRPIKSSCVIL